MAHIQNLKLKIRKLGGDKSEVEIDYDLEFSPAEAQAGSVFMEQVHLRGSDPVFDDDLGPELSGQIVKAKPGRMHRTVRKTIPSRILDEDKDIVGGNYRLDSKDEVYAQVSVIPFSPRGAVAQSRLIKGQFGHMEEKAVTEQKQEKGKPEQGESQKGQQEQGESQKGQQEQGESQKGQQEQGESQKGQQEQGESQKGQQEQGESQKGQAGTQS